MDSSSIWQGLLFGGFSSCIADIITLPIDFTKTRLQLVGEGGKSRLYNGAFDCITKTVQKEGIKALWKGLEPALWRQASYGSLRYGLYTPIKEKLAPGVPKKDLPLGIKILSGALSGAFSSALANPCDLIKVRMMASGMESSSGPAYRWFWGAFFNIVKTEGVRGLYIGVGPTVSRATVLAAAELASYDEIKQRILARQILEEGLPLHAVTAMCAGFIAAFACNPFDVVKSRIMRSSQYSGMADCFSQTIQNEGVPALWKGFIPAWTRVGPRVVIIFITMEQLRMRFD